MEGEVFQAWEEAPMQNQDMLEMERLYLSAGLETLRRTGGGFPGGGMSRLLPCDRSR